MTAELDCLRDLLKFVSLIALRDDCPTDIRDVVVLREGASQHYAVAQARRLIMEAAVMDGNGYEISDVVAGVANGENPYAWTIPGDDNADMNGFIPARISKDGEFSMPLYRRPPATASSQEAAPVDVVERLIKDRMCRYCFHGEDGETNIRDAIAYWRGEDHLKGADGDIELIVASIADALASAGLLSPSRENGNAGLREAVAKTSFDEGWERAIEEAAVVAGSQSENDWSVEEVVSAIRALASHAQVDSMTISGTESSTITTGDPVAENDAKGVKHE